MQFEALKGIEGIMSNHAISHDQHQVEQADGYRWFFVVGLVAVAFSVFLATVDQRLSESDGERVLGATLRELRTAQTSLPSRVTDSRQTLSFMHSESNGTSAHDEAH